MNPDTAGRIAYSAQQQLEAAERVKDAVTQVIFVSQLSKKMLAVQWVLGNGIVVMMIILIILLPFILRWKEGIAGTVKEYPGEWAYLAGRALQWVRVFLLRRWYVWYGLLIFFGVLAFNAIPHLIPAPRGAEYLFQQLR